MRQKSPFKNRLNSILLMLLQISCDHIYTRKNPSPLLRYRSCRFPSNSRINQRCTLLHSSSIVMIQVASAPEGQGAPGINDALSAAINNQHHPWITSRVWTIIVPHLWKTRTEIYDNIKYRRQSTSALWMQIWADMVPYTIAHVSKG